MLVLSLAACGGGSGAGPDEQAEPIPAPLQAVVESPAVLDAAEVVYAPIAPSLSVLALQKEGARLNAAELEQIAKTGLLPKAFDGALASGAEGSAPTTLNTKAVSKSLAASKSAASRVPVYRFFNTRTSAHFFTTSETERANLVATQPFMTFEGPAFHASATVVPGLSPVHRFYNRSTGVHFYTISEAERAHIALTMPTFSYEGIGYYASTLPGTGYTPLYRFFYTAKGFHFYTNSESEKNSIIATLPQYSYEGIGYYVLGSDWQTPAIAQTYVTNEQCFETGSNILVNCAATSAATLSTSQDGRRRFPDNNEFTYLLGSHPATDCVVSDLTGLIWEGKTASGPRIGTNTYTYLGNGSPDDVSGYVAMVNAARLCGFNDWRVPAPQEMQNLVRYGVVGPLLNNNSSFPNTSDTAGGYWTNSEAPLMGATQRWTVSFGTGARTSAANTARKHVRLVRGAKWNGPRFITTTLAYSGDASANVAFDRQTGLSWRRCVEGQRWNGATCVNAATTLRHPDAFARGNTMPGWRVPDVKELSSLLEPSQTTAPLIDPTIFPNTPANQHWTTTPVVNSPLPYDVEAWSVHFGFGVVAHQNRSFLFNVRLVQ